MNTEPAGATPPNIPILSIPSSLWNWLFARAGRMGRAVFYGALILMGGAVSVLVGAMVAMIPGAIGCEGLGFCGEWTEWLIYAGAIIGGLLGTNHSAKIIEGFRRADRTRNELDQHEDRGSRY